VRALLFSLLIALAFAGLWHRTQPPLPQLPTGDIFTSLATARHLSRGDGLVNDTIYPLFTAYRWGQEVPQPLLHRPPGLAVLMLPAWWLCGGDPVRAEALVRPVMLAQLSLLVLLGAWGLWRQRRAQTAGFWLLLLLVNPLLALGVHWGWGEIPVALLLLALWLMLRRRRPADLSLGATAAYALLCGLLALVRSDLLWVPVLWWVVIALVARRRRPRRAIGRTALAAIVGVTLLLPWWTHVHRHTGNFLTNPLTDSVQLDLRAQWWDYPLLRSRTPLPLSQNLAENAWPAVLKTGAGVRHYLRTLGHWLPWLIWIVSIGAWGRRTWVRIRRGHRWFVASGPPGLLALTLGLMVLQYAFFSQETRHLLPLLPLLVWETALLVDHALRRRLRRPAGRGVALLALAAAALILTPPSLGGEWGNVRHARESVDRVAAVTAAAVATIGPGPIFADTAVIPWRLDRSYIWNPFDAAIEAEIRAAIPALRDAPYVRLQPPPEAAADE
jgi:hypothetical protein